MAMGQKESQTIQELNGNEGTKSLCPPPEVACATCPNSMWFASEKGLQCYCRIMYLVSYDSANNVKRPLIVACDGESMDLNG